MNSFDTISSSTIQELASGNEKAFRLVFDTYWKKIYNVSYKLMKSAFYAEEMTQEIFLKLWQKRELLYNVTDIEAYLNRVAKNYFIDKLRSKAFTIKHEEFLLNNYLTDNESPSTQTEYKYLEESLNEAVANLPENLRLVYTLNREDGLSHKTIAEQLGITVLTSKNYMVRALKSIRQHLRKHEGVTFTLPYIFLIFF